jgi:hypothetical protein
MTEFNPRDAFFQTGRELENARAEQQRLKIPDSRHLDTTFACAYCAQPVWMAANYEEVLGSSMLVSCPYAECKKKFWVVLEFRPRPLSDAEVAVHEESNTQRMPVL